MQEAHADAGVDVNDHNGDEDEVDHRGLDSLDKSCSADTERRYES
mgnify:CR=1 FL=1